MNLFHYKIKNEIDFRVALDIITYFILNFSVPLKRSYIPLALPIYIFLHYYNFVESKIHLFTLL